MSRSVLAAVAAIPLALGAVSAKAADIVDTAVLLIATIDSPDAEDRRRSTAPA